MMQWRPSRKLLGYWLFLSVVLNGLQAFNVEVYKEIVAAYRSALIEAARNYQAALADNSELQTCRDTVRMVIAMESAQ